MSEAHYRNAICSWLRFKGAFYFIHDSVGIYDVKLGRYRKRNNVHHKLGIPDICGIWKEKFLGIEVKSPGGRLSDHQKRILQEINEHGGIGIVAVDFNDVERELRQRGLYP